MLRLCSIWLTFNTVQRGSLTPSVFSRIPRGELRLLPIECSFDFLTFFLLLLQTTPIVQINLFSNRLCALYLLGVGRVRGFSLNE